VASPFLGGGSFELHLARQFGLKVTASDAFEPLANFWKVLKSRPTVLMETCQDNIPNSAIHHKSLLAGMFDRRHTNVYRATCFYNTIRTSYGSVIYETFVPDKVKTLKASIPRLQDVDLCNVTVKHASFEESIPIYSHQWMYLDPPYHVESRLYANSSSPKKHRPSQINSFDHVLLRDMLKRHPLWMMSYNDDAYIRELYRGHQIINLHWKYRANQSKNSSEILILSPRYPHFPRP
jgi:DNA adenine methylase